MRFLNYEKEKNQPKLPKNRNKSMAKFTYFEGQFIKIKDNDQKGVQIKKEIGAIKLYRAKTIRK